MTQLQANTSQVNLAEPKTLVNKLPQSVKMGAVLPSGAEGVNLAVSEDPVADNIAALTRLMLKKQKAKNKKKDDEEVEKNVFTEGMDEEQAQSDQLPADMQLAQNTATDAPKEVMKEADKMATSTTSTTSTTATISTASSGGMTAAAAAGGFSPLLAVFGALGVAAAVGGGNTPAPTTPTTPTSVTDTAANLAANKTANLATAKEVTVIGTASVAQLVEIAKLTTGTIIAASITDAPATLAANMDGVIGKNAAVNVTGNATVAELNAIDALTKGVITGAVSDKAANLAALSGTGNAYTVTVTDAATVAQLNMIKAATTGVVTATATETDAATLVGLTTAATDLITVTMVAASTAAADLNTIDGKTGVAVDATAITELTGTDAELTTLYAAGIAGTITGLGNDFNLAENEFITLTGESAGIGKSVSLAQLLTGFTGSGLTVALTATTGSFTLTNDATPNGFIDAGDTFTATAGTVTLTYTVSNGTDSVSHNYSIIYA